MQKAPKRHSAAQQEAATAMPEEAARPRVAAVDELAASLAASPRMLAQRRVLDAVFGAPMRALPAAPRHGPAAPVGVVQRRPLDWLKAADLRALPAPRQLPEIEAACAAIQAYEALGEVDPMAEAPVLDRLVETLSRAKYKLDDLVLEDNEAAFDPLLTRLTDLVAKLTPERRRMVARLPLSSRKDDLLNLFPNDSFLGADVRALIGPKAQEPGVAGAPAGAGHYARAAGSAFGAKEPGPEDVIQGKLGDCWLLAPLIALVQTPEGKARIRAMIQPNDAPSEAYNVELFTAGEDRKFTPKVVTVIATFPARKGRGGEDRYLYAPSNMRLDEAAVPLWPAIIEKAFAQHVGNHYAALEGSKRGSRTAFETILGKAMESEGETARAAAVAKGKTAGMASAAGAPMDAKAIIAAKQQGRPVVVSNGTHYYNVQQADGDGCVLYNPHGYEEDKRGWDTLADWLYEVQR